jgi:hypothetical protein
VVWQFGILKTVSRERSLAFLNQRFISTFPHFPEGRKGVYTYIHVGDEFHRSRERAGPGSWLGAFSYKVNFQLKKEKVKLDVENF